MPRDCNKCGEPELDPSAIDCDGEYYPEGCVILQENIYLGIEDGDRLTNLISKIVSKFKAISQALGRRVDYYALYNSGNFYQNDADAALGGISLGKPYIDINGFLRVRIS